MLGNDIRVSTGHTSHTREYCGVRTPQDLLGIIQTHRKTTHNRSDVVVLDKLGRKVQAPKTLTKHIKRRKGNRKS